MISERLLLCRPLGGLNDMLCQIERACRYAERFDRTVIVDAQHSATYFRDRFSTCFVSRQERLLLDIAAAPVRLDALDVFPACLSGRLGDYSVRFEHVSQRFVEASTGVSPSFDFERDYDQPLLVHHSSGGGTGSIAALARLRLRPELVELLRLRRNGLGKAYSGVHVRDTDYKARYRQTDFAKAIDPALPIFLATDNREALAHFRAVFGSDRIASFAELPPAGERLHHIPDPAQAFTRNRDAVLDLVMLALATHLFLFELEPNPYRARHSGFSVLAANLKNAPTVLAGLISDDGGPSQTPVQG